MASPVPPVDPREPAGFDGAWLTDPEALAAAADDFGHVVHRPPYVVARPGSVEDVVAVCRYAAETGMPVVARGCGHNTSGAGQTTGGIVVDMSGLNRVGAPSGDRISVEAGARWSAVLDAALTYGRTPPTLTDYLETTVGGTLSAGGIGGAAHLHGPQVDNVAELEVVTIDGDRVICSPDQQHEVFDAALAGGGYDGFIVRASLALVRAPVHVRFHQLFYDDLDLFVRDQLTLEGDSRWFHLEGQALAPDGAKWRYMIEAAFDVNLSADVDRLGFDRASSEIAEITYRDLAHRMDPGVPQLIATGDWYRPHPWFSAFVPASRIRQFLAGIMPALRPADIGPLPVLIYPLRRGDRPAPGLATPSEETFFNVSVLRTCDVGATAVAIDDNEGLLRIARQHGGTWYPVGVLPEDLPRSPSPDHTV